MADARIDKAVQIAKAEVGYHEGRSGGHWNNHTKYPPAMPDLAWAQNQPWCAVFVAWAAEQAGLRPFYPRTASVPVAAKWFKQRGQWSEYPAVGAQAIFGNYAHTGIVVDFDDTYVWTVEGNTNVNGSAEGDGVYLKRHGRRDAWVLGYGYPAVALRSADPNYRAPAAPKPPAEPTSPEPAPPADKVTLADRRITESSWLVESVKYPGHAYTGNDENGPIYCIELATGRVVGTFTLKGFSLKDPESAAIRRSDAVLFVGDIGDNDAKRSDLTLYSLTEPGPGDHGALTANRFPIAYPDGARNGESLLIHPVTGDRFIISKQAKGNVYRAKEGTLIAGRRNVLEHVASGLPEYITDATFSIDGRFAFARQKGERDTITVLDGATWKFLDKFPAQKVEQPESIAVDPDGIHLWIGSEGAHSPLIRVTLPPAYRPKGDAPQSSIRIDWRRWKLTEPIGADEHPKETLPPALAHYENAPYFTRHADHVTFRAPVNGVTTSHSGNPRSELRELNLDGSLAKWSSRHGTHTLRGSCAVIHLPGRKPRVVIAQIHDDKDDVVMLVVDGSDVYLSESLGKGNGSRDHHLFSGYKLGALIGYEIVADSRGIRVTANGHTVELKGKVCDNAYHKGGCYSQANESNGTGDAEVDYYYLESSHAA